MVTDDATGYPLVPKFRTVTIGNGTIGIHSQKEQRYICHECQQTYSATKGTVFYRLHKDPALVLLVITLIAYACPIQAIVKACQLCERTVRKWWERSGEHSRVVHEHKVEHSQLDLQHVQGDEIKAKIQEGHFWMAMAIMVPTRL